MVKLKTQQKLSLVTCNQSSLFLASIVGLMDSCSCTFPESITSYSRPDINDNINLIISQQKKRTRYETGKKLNGHSVKRVFAAFCYFIFYICHP